MEYHRQCKLTRPSSDGATEVMHTWLPECFAKTGMTLDLESSSGTTEEGWVVKEVYDRRPSKEVSERERDYKKNRKASDV